MKNSILLLFITLITCHGLSANESKTNENVFTVTCQDITVNLDVYGNIDIVAEDLIASSDGNIEFTELSQQNFDCSHNGSVNVILYAYDDQQNVSECTAVVTVVDDIAPIITCQDQTIHLDGSGFAGTTATELVSSSYDNCTVGAITATRTEFTSSDLGTNTVTISVDDLNGNSANCNSNVTVVDDQAPMAICQDVTVSLDNLGNASLSSFMIDNGSFDNSNEIFTSVSESTFNCNQLGTNVVILTVLDASGNMSLCDASVTVEDVEAPTALCNDLSITLNTTGEATLSPSHLNNGSTDNCMISFMSISQELFSEADLGNNTIELTLFDEGQNIATCTSNVHVSVSPQNPLMLEATAFSMASEDELQGPIVQDDVEDKANEVQMSLYPNPVRNTATTVVLRNMLKGAKEITVIVYDQNGTAIMFERRIEINSELKLKLDNFQPFITGVYTVQVNIDGKVLSQQLVVG